MNDTDLTGLLLNGKALSAQVFTSHVAATLTRNIDEVGTLSLTVNDPKRTLTTSGFLIGPPPTVTLDGVLYELAQASKTGSNITLTFEDAVVAELRRRSGLLTAKEGSTTVTAFAGRLVAEVPGARFFSQPGETNKVPLARGSEDDPTEDSWTALQRLAQDRGWRCYADRNAINFGSDEWLFARHPARSILEHNKGVEDIDWEADTGNPSVRAGFRVTASRWSVSPGQPVKVLEQGLGSGDWLVRSYTRELSRKTADVELVRKQPALPEPVPEPRDDDGSVADGSGSGNPVTAGPVSARGYSWPLSGRVTSDFGQRRGSFHAGIDIAVPIGTPVGAANSGTVEFAGSASGYGTAVYLRHPDGVITRYGHLSRLSVLRGAQVERGEQIALSGNTGNSTGPHLHFEVRPGNTPVNPLDYLPRGG